LKAHDFLSCIFLFFCKHEKPAPRGRKHASAQQKARRGNPARASGAVSVNTRFSKILVTRVKKFFAELAGSSERPENSANFDKTLPGKARGGVDQRPAIVGTICRAIPHSSGSGGTAPAGVVAQWIAVRADS
jgi:hypothetical protein